MRLAFPLSSSLKYAPLSRPKEGLLPKKEQPPLKSVLQDRFDDLLREKQVNNYKHLLR